jgi:polysaccharide pyruvyl transferase WcaK-like protein
MRRLRPPARFLPPLAPPFNLPVRARPGALPVCHIFSGLGGGNLGEEFIARAFWSRLPPQIRLNVELSEEAIESRAPYPAPHRYTSIAPRHIFWRGWQRLRDPFRAQAGLIAGTTPITEDEGTAVISSMARRLDPYRRSGLAVDAVGIGADHLSGAEARGIFIDHIRPAVRSWTVRTTACRDALIDLGVAPESVDVGADWAWLYHRQSDRSAWAAAVWQSLGVDLTRPLLAANIVHLNWINCREAKRATAAAFDRVARSHGVQIALFCNDFRSDPWMDRAAAEDMASLMRVRVAMVPALFYSPDEALALLGCAQVTVGQRYHFVIESAMAGAVPVAIPRMQKMSGLVRDLGCPSSGRIDRVDADHLAGVIADALDRRDFWRSAMAAGRSRLARRAEANFHLIRSLPPYDRIHFP